MIRAPNHLGELVLALPALERAAELWRDRPLVQLPEALAPLLRLTRAEMEPLPMENRHRLLGAARELRRRGVETGVLLTPSFSAALLFALAGLRTRRGTDTDARGWLLTDRVPRAPLLEGHRVREYLTLVAGSEPGEGELPRPGLGADREARHAWREAAADGGLPGDPGPLVGLVPGGRASSRRWSAASWRGVARRLADRGVRLVLFGGPDERELTAEVADGRPGVHDLGGRTDLMALVGGLAACDAVAANDTGPMHVAAALGRPLVAVWGAGDPRQTRPLGERVRLVGSFDLPCHPCVRNSCPRTGPGYRLDRAERECLRLIGVDRVVEELEGLLDGNGTREASAPPGERSGESGPVRRGEP